MTTTPEAVVEMTRADEIAAIVRSALIAQVVHEEHREPKQRERVAASGYHPCLRRMVHDIVDADKRPPWSPGQLSNFKRGKAREKDIRLWLENAGERADPPFEVGEKDVSIEFYADAADPSSQLLIKGYIDGLLKIPSTGEHGVYETKSWADHIVARIDTFQDLISTPWTRGAAYQLAAYVWGREVDFGWYVLDQRNDVPKIIGTTLDECAPFAEDLLCSAEQAMKLRGQILRKEVSRDDLPVICDPAECKRCWANGSVCFPPDIGGEGTHIETDEEIIDTVARCVELKGAKAEHDRLWKKVQTRFRGVELAIVGDHLLKGTWQQQTKYDVPNEVKQKYKSVSPKGKFVLRVEDTKEEE